MEKTRGKSVYVFVTYQGHRYSPPSPYHYEALQKAVRRANKARAKAELDAMEHVQWHDLRRTCGCRLLQDRRFSMEQVSRWLGHSSVKVTESRYAFLSVAHLHRAVAESEGKVVALHG
jgi:integrase